MSVPTLRLKRWPPATEVLTSTWLVQIHFRLLRRRAVCLLIQRRSVVRGRSSRLPGGTFAVSGLGAVTVGTVVAIGADGAASFADGDFQIDADGNTTIDGFLNCQGPSLVVANMPVGTIAAPPAGMVINQLWLDTTTSATHPIVRLSTVNT